MKSMKFQLLLMLLMSVMSLNKMKAQSITYFPSGPSYYYERDGLEIKSFASCGTYVYGPKACYRIRNKNNYTVLFRVQYLLKSGKWITGDEHRIEAGGIGDFEDFGGCAYCSGVADIKIYMVE